MARQKKGRQQKQKTAKRAGNKRSITARFDIAHDAARDREKTEDDEVNFGRH